MATLDNLKEMLQITSASDDNVLQKKIETANSWVLERIMAGHEQAPEVQEAILMLAARLYKRRQSPEGVAGWGDLGVIRVMAKDPDIKALLEHHLDYASKVSGLA
jgi:hypothetical protein